MRFIGADAPVTGYGVANGWRVWRLTSGRWRWHAYAGAKVRGGEAESKRDAERLAQSALHEVRREHARG